MDYFGDASGHFKGVLQGDCEVCVVAIVAGDQVSCGRCPKRTVRRVDDIPEAKWHDLLDKQKRRLFECFADNDHIQFGYAVFRQEQLKSMDDYHLLYQDVSFPPKWDLALEGYAYGEILYEMGADEDGRPVFEFDRVSAKKQSEKVENHVKTFVPDINTFIKGSRQSNGIQAADCLAGAVSEDLRKGTNWLDYLDSEDVVECSETSLIQVENDLTSH